MEPNQQEDTGVTPCSSTNQLSSDYRVKDEGRVWTGASRSVLHVWICRLVDPQSLNEQGRRLVVLFKFGGAHQLSSCKGKAHVGDSVLR